METPINFANVSLHWLGSALENVLSWIMISVQTIASLIYLLFMAAIKVAIAAGHWLANSLQELFNIIAVSCQWLMTSLKISENGFVYISGLMVVAVIVMFVLLMKARNQVNWLTNQNNTLRSQLDYVRSQINWIHQEQQKEKNRQDTQAMINVVWKIAELLLSQ